MAASALDKVAAEAETGTDLVSVPLGDTDVDVLPVTEWRSSGLRSLREGDFDSWAERCLTPESYETWLDVDPTMAQAEAFFTAWSEATGQAPGESRASRRSSRSTARR